MDGPPPPPPPHGENPHTTEGEYRKSSDLPTGNYDIFVVPPHSSGSGFLYLPSLQTNRNSFLAGAVSTLLLVIAWSLISPAVKTWYIAAVSSNGNGNSPMAMVVVAFGVGIVGWALGISQSKMDGFFGFGGNWGGGLGGGSSGGRGAGADGANANFGHGQQSKGGGTGQQQRQQQGGNYGGGTNSNNQYGGNQHQNQGGADSKPDKENEENEREKEKEREREREQEREREKEREREREEKERARAKEKEKKDAAEREREREREEAKRKEDLRRKMEEFKRKREAEAKEKQRKAEREAMEKELKERREQLEREMAAAKAAAEKEARERLEKEVAEARAKHEKEAAEAKAEAERLAAEARAETDRIAREAKEKAAKEASEREAAAKAAAQKEAMAKFAALKEAAAKRYAEKKAQENKEKAANNKPASPASATSAPRTPSPKKPPFPTARTSVEEDDAYSFRPYDRPRRPYGGASGSSAYSESSYAPSQSTAHTTPPPSHRSSYSTKDPDKIVIQGVYQFNNAFMKTPVAQLVSGQGMVTDGLVLRITTEGLFVDDDLRGVGQREWDVKAWTLKLTEVWCPQMGAPPAKPGSSNPFSFRRGASAHSVPTTEESDAFVVNLLKVCKNTCRLASPSAFFARSATASGVNESVRAPPQSEFRGLHVLRASLRDQEGKRYVFVLQDTEAWKVAIGLQRLRAGALVRNLGVTHLPVPDCKSVLNGLGYI
ncbi:hypothetical protein N7478_004461 [Penicillium angulare]|uniref:uncharacterized protein n=1 Tax=Penicillium angulare TaxID=116970 RepID=UPI00253FB544|nr:uncharacterized protein N7478_004461 [Penicillium angulare]KAJ5279089.1 hypothetical protein N7478_004461 [Penicillium angulare]